MPHVTEEQVKVYMELFGKDVKENSKSMYKGKFLRSIRVVCRAVYIFVQGRVSAEMFKKCIYSVDVKLDKLGVVQQCQCECAAGMGPEAHCKHVGLVRHALTKVKEGIITQETCTQILQTFHQAKKYTGSPVKMENIILRSSRNPLTALKDFDPRPLDCHNMVGYEDLFRSVWLNSSAKNPPIRQMYAPANVYAIANDHDYQNKSYEDVFLDNIHVTAITCVEQEAIEIKTRGQGDNKFWKEERLLRLQASMFGRICTATDRTDFHKLAESLTQHKAITSSAIKHGRKYEPVARDAYCRDKNVSVAESGIVVSMDVPYIGCSPDGLVGAGGIIEIKCPYTACDLPPGPDTIPYLQRGENGDLSLSQNHNYYYQVMGSLCCTTREWCDFVVWTFKGMVVIRIQRDEHFISQMKLQLSTFFTKYFRPVLLEKYLFKDSHLFLSSKERI